MTFMQGINYKNIYFRNYTRWEI